MSLLGPIEPLPGHSVRMGERGRKEYIRQFLGKSRSPYDEPESIAESRHCPKVGDEDRKDRLMRIIDVDVTRKISDEPCNLWIITTTSSTDFDDNQDMSPLALPTAFSWHAEQFERYTEFDVKKRLIRTTAGTIIPVKIEDSRWVISARKNLAVVPAVISTLNNALNSGSVIVDGVQFAKLTLMCKGVRVGEVQRETFRGKRLEFREVSFQLHYRREGWKNRTANADFVQLVEAWHIVREKDGSIKLGKDGQPVRRRGKKRQKIMIGEPRDYITEPWPLAKDGTMLQEDYEPEDVQFIESDVYFPKDFNILPLR